MDTRERAIRDSILYDIPFERFVKGIHGVTTEEINNWNLLTYLIYNGRKHKQDQCATAPKVQWLLNHGANPNHVDTHGYCPLTEAARYGLFDVVRVLVAAGAEINRLDENGKPHDTFYNDGAGITALTIAVRSLQDPHVLASKDPQLCNTISVLLELGADVNVPDNKGRTVYDYFSPKWNTQIAKALPPRIVP